LSSGELPTNKNCGQDKLRSDAAKWLRLIVTWRATKIL
jgi:hypothetical protein